MPAIAYLFLVLALYGGSVSSAEPAAVKQWEVFSLPEGDKPVKVRLAFNLRDIHEVNDGVETFEFSGFLTLAWKDSRQAFDAAAEGVSEKLYHGGFQFNELSPAWYPQVVLVNATEMSDPQGVLLRVKPDGSSTLIQLVHGVAESQFALRSFPFDSQRLEAIFGILGFDDREVVLVAESSFTTDSAAINVPQWDLIGVTAAPREIAVPYAGAGRSSAVVVQFDLKRRPFFVVRLVLVPLLAIVLLSWSVFWMDRSSLGDRMSVSFVGLLTAVAYQAMLGDIMPHISYVTFTNAFISFSFLVMAATVFVNLVVAACDRRGEHERGDRIDRRSRWVFPLVYGGLTLAAAVYTLW